MRIAMRIAAIPSWLFVASALRYIHASIHLATQRTPVFERQRSSRVVGRRQGGRNLRAQFWSTTPRGPLVSYLVGGSVESNIHGRLRSDQAKARWR